MGRGGGSLTVSPWDCLSSNPLSPTVGALALAMTLGEVKKMWRRTFVSGVEGVGLDQGFLESGTERKSLT